MNVSIQRSRNTVKSASEMLLAQNFEAALETVPGILSDRLFNAKFVGPGHPLSGIAPGWEGESCTAALRHRLMPGAGLAGSYAHLLSGHTGLTQNKRQVRAGETLVCEVWARCTGKPVTLTVSVRPMPASQNAYATAEFLVDGPQFARYAAELKMPVDDDDACFSLRAGEGIVWIDQVHLRPKGEDLLCAEVIRQMAAMKIPALRFPGGIVSTNYTWSRGIGPVHLRENVCDTAFCRDWTIYYDFGTDEYLQLCADLGMTPTITVNLGTGNAEEAAGWARYVAAWYAGRGFSLPMTYWHIGNHPYLATMAWMTPDMYVRTVREYVPRIKAACPNARIVGVSPCTGEKANDEPEWLTKVLDGVGGMLDVIQCQTYGLQGIQPPALDPKVFKAGEADPVRQMAVLAGQVESFEAMLRNFIRACRRRKLATRIGIAEWNYWTTASHRDGHNFFEPDDALHALFIAGMLNMLTGLAPDLEVAHYYNLVNCMGILQQRGGRVTVHAGVDVFNLYRPALPGNVVPLNLTTPALARNGAKAVSATMMENDGGTWLFLVNYHPAEPATIDLKALAGGAATVKALSAGETTARPRAVKLAVRAGRLTLPPLTIARVKYNG